MVGEFSNGIEHGLGTKFLFPWEKKGGSIGRFVGEWFEGKMWNGWIYNKINKELIKYANGKVVVDLRK